MPCFPLTQVSVRRKITGVKTQTPHPSMTFAMFIALAAVLASCSRSAEKPQDITAFYAVIQNGDGSPIPSLFIGMPSTNAGRWALSALEKTGGVQLGCRASVPPGPTSVTSAPTNPPGLSFLTSLAAWFRPPTASAACFCSAHFQRMAFEDCAGCGTGQCNSGGGQYEDGCLCGDNNSCGCQEDQICNNPH